MDKRKWVVKIFLLLAFCIQKHLNQRIQILQRQVSPFFSSSHNPRKIIFYSITKDIRIWLNSSKKPLLNSRSKKNVYMNNELVIKRNSSKSVSRSAVPTTPKFVRVGVRWLEGQWACWGQWPIPHIGRGASRPEILSWGKDLSLKARIWALRMRLKPRGCDLSVEDGIWV